MTSTAPGAARNELSEQDDRLFVDRARLGLRLVNAGIAAVFVGWIVFNPGVLPLVSVVQAVNFAVVAAVLWVLRDPTRRNFNHVVAFVAYGVTIIATAVVGVLTTDGTTPLLILVGLAVIAAVLVPWRPMWHVTGMALTVVAAIGVASMSAQSLHWMRNAGAIAPTLIAAIYLSRTLSRQRDEATRATRERHAREEHLREANRRLEREIEEHRKTEATLRFAMAELDHRVKNTLATVQSVADQTLRSSTSMDGFGEAFAGRIQAMARIHTALASRRWHGLTLGELVELVVGPFRHDPASVRIDCNGSFVPGELVRALGMALHELATNAAKYGALSSIGGEVAISAHADASDSRLRIRWRERGGPPVDEPARRGFGTRLIQDALTHEADGTVVLGFSADGVRCDIDLPLPAAPS